MQATRIETHMKQIRWWLVWVAVQAVAAQGDVIHLKSGATYQGRVLGFSDGAFVFEIDGTTRRAPAIYVDRVEMSAAAVPDPEAPGSEGPSTPPAPSVAEPVAPSPAVQTPGAGKATPAAAGTARLTLATHWQSRLGRGNLSMGDAARLLARCGTPQIDLAGKPIVLWGNITYLMPIQKAKQILGLGLSSRSPMTCAAFPPDSFFYHGFSGNYEDGFNRLYLLTDYADQVVGIQWQDNTSREKRWFPAYTDSYATDWSLYNFVNDRKKANPNWLIGHYVCRGNQTILGHAPAGGVGVEPGQTGVNEDVIRIDSELFSVSKNRYNLVSDEKSRERNRLLLPQPIVDLMLYVVQQSR